MEEHVNELILPAAAAAAAAAAVAAATTTTTTKMGQFRNRKNPSQSLKQVIIHL